MIRTVQPAKVFLMQTRTYIQSIALALTLIFSTPAVAQNATAQGTTDPGQISERFRETLATDDANLPSGFTGQEVQDNTDPNIAEGASSRASYQLPRFEINGNAVYDDRMLQDEILKPYQGVYTDRDFESIRQMITLKYREDGYVLARVTRVYPDTENGSLVVNVQEGRIGAVNIYAPEERQDLQPLLNEHAAKVSALEAFNITDLETTILTINNIPGLTASSIVSKSDEMRAAVDIDIKTSFDPVQFSARIDNYSSRFLGPINLTGTTTFNSPTCGADSLSLFTANAPGSPYELLYGALAYRSMLNAKGTIGEAFISRVLTEPGYNLSAFDVKGQADLYSVTIRHPMKRSRNVNVEIRGGFDWREVTSSNNAPDFREDNLRVLRAGVRMNALDSKFGPAASRANLTVSQGLDIFGASEQGDPNLSRPLAEPVFTKAVLQARRIQTLKGPVQAMINFEGQVSDGPLLSSEEFGVGGYYNGRGYDPSEIVGDEGVSIQAELIWNDVVKPETEHVRNVSGFAFYDVGKVWNDDFVVAANDRTASVASVGFGVRMDAFDHAKFSATAAFPLTRERASDSSNDPRFYFSLQKTF